MNVKRIGVVWCAVVCLWLSLTACAKPPVTPVADGFRCRVSLDYGGAVYEATLDRLDASQAMLTIAKPETLKGLTMTWNGQEVSMTYAGMTMSLEEASLPVSAAVKLLCRTLDACRDQAEARSVCEGTIEGIPYTVTFDDQTGMPLTLSVPSVPIQVVFSAWEMPTDE